MKKKKNRTDVSRKIEAGSDKDSDADTNVGLRSALKRISTTTKSKEIKLAGTGSKSEVPRPKTEFDSKLTGKGAATVHVVRFTLPGGNKHHHQRSCSDDSIDAAGDREA